MFPIVYKHSQLCTHLEKKRVLNHLCDFCKAIKHFCAETFHTNLGLGVKNVHLFPFYFSFYNKNANHRMQQVGGLSQTVQCKVLICDSKMGLLCQPNGAVFILIQDNRTELLSFLLSPNQLPWLSNVQVSLFLFLRLWIYSRWKVMDCQISFFHCLSVSI